MMRLLFRTGVSLVFLAIALVGITSSMMKSVGASKRAVPEMRDMGSETRSVTAEATNIVVSGSINLTLRQGAVPSLIVRGEERLLGNVETVQDGENLVIGIKGMVLHHRNPLQVILVLPELTSLNLTGSGDTEANGFNGEKVEVSLTGRGTVKFNGRYKHVYASLSGSGDMEMNGGASDEVEVEQVGSGDMTVVGSAKQFRVQKSGTGDLDAEHLAADDTVLDARGSGNAVLQARKSVQVSIVGSGDVTVIGNPGERTTERTGSGSVEFRQ